MAINYNEEEFGLQLPNNNQGIMEVAGAYNIPTAGQYGFNLIELDRLKDAGYDPAEVSTWENKDDVQSLIRSLEPQASLVNEYGYPLMASLSGSIPNKVSAFDQMANYDWSGFDDNIAKNIALANQMNTTLDNTLGEESVDPWTSFYGNPELYQGFVERGEPLAVSSTPSKWEQITGMVGDVWQGAKDQLGSGWESLKTTAQIPIGIIGSGF